jgi:hypothetical protein
MRVQKFGVVIRQALGSLIKASLMDLPTFFHWSWAPIASGGH